MGLISTLKGQGCANFEREWWISTLKCAVQASFWHYTGALSTSEPGQILHFPGTGEGILERRKYSWVTDYSMKAWRTVRTYTMKRDQLIAGRRESGMCMWGRTRPTYWCKHGPCMRARCMRLLLLLLIIAKKSRLIRWLVKRDLHTVVRNWLLLFVFLKTPSFFSANK